MYLACTGNCTSCAMLKFVGVVGGLVRHQARALGVCHTKLRTCSVRLGLKNVQKNYNSFVPVWSVLWNSEGPQVSESAALMSSLFRTSVYSVRLFCK